MAYNPRTFEKEHFVMKLFGPILVLLLSSTAWAQSNEEKLEEKLKESWLVDGGWIADYDKAREEAKKSGKLIFAYFTRSYAY
jgi:hypothetical protein